MLVSPKDLDSWKSLLKAATIRNQRPLLDLAENVKEGEIPMSVIIGSVAVFLQWRETWKAFLKQRRLLHRFLNLIREEPDTDKANYCNIESQASDKLYEFIRLDLLENPRLVKKVDLTDKLMIYMRSMGATKISESTKKHFRRKLVKEFCDLLQFEDILNNNKLCVLHKNISKV